WGLAVRVGVGWDSGEWTISDKAGMLTFLRQHVDFPKTNAANDHRYCNLIIQRRRLPCTPTHDFINAHPRQIRNICSRGGRCYSRYNQCDSKAAYKLTRCRLVRRNPGARCVYRGRSETRRIRLACDNERLPVRLVRVL
uniref:Ribonuclease A-domain domain-containing protein n=1 Tax=Pelusios castaneus TaxID=367368 RepID=A0A8C8VJA7_9SAUR